MSANKQTVSLKLCVQRETVLASTHDNYKCAPIREREQITMQEQPRNKLILLFYMMYHMVVFKTIMYVSIIF
jgi:hypothetical protein